MRVVLHMLETVPEKFRPHRSSICWPYQYADDPTTWVAPICIRTEVAKGFLYSTEMDICIFLRESRTHISLINYFTGNYCIYCKCFV